MPGFVPFAGRHPLFLSSAVAGAVLMATPAQAETEQPQALTDDIRKGFKSLR